MLLTPRRDDGTTPHRSCSSRSSRMNRPRISSMAESPLRNDGITIDSPVCGQSFRPVGRRRYCSDACRQAAWRQRYRATAHGRRQSMSARLARRAYLGEQPCPDCQVFCRRVEPGGPCPPCDAPVALVDLLDAGSGT